MSLKWPGKSGNVVETRRVSQIPASKVNVAVCKGGTLVPQRGQEFTPSPPRTFNYHINTTNRKMSVANM